jgi:hypothetical protein
MIEAAFPDFLLIVMGFLAGFGCAIWLAIELDHGAKDIASQAGEELDSPIEPC